VAGCAGGVAFGAITTTPYTLASSARRSSYNKFTPRASIRYEVAPRTNVYFTYSQGFRGGEWNSVIPNDNPNVWRDVNQETINSFELGVKSAGNRYHFDVSGFYYDYRNLQVSSTTFVTDAATGITAALVVLQNAPKAKIYGIDANFDYDLTENFKVRAGFTYLHARFGDRFVYNTTGVTSIVGFNQNDDVMKTLINASGLNQNLSGMPMPRSPDYSGFIGMEYKIPQGDGGFVFAANLKFTSKYVVTNPAVWGGDPTYLAKLALDPNYLPDNTLQFATAAGAPYVSRANEQRAVQKGYALLNASLTWTDPGDHYYVRVWGNNLTDRTYRVHYSPTALGTYTPIGEPRTFGGTIGYKF
jgi:iron complex outermembrane receptor protein